MSLRLIKALFKPAKPRITEKEKQTSLIRSAEKKEKRIISGTPIEDGFHTEKARGLPILIYKYYYAHKYFLNRLIDVNMVSRLRKGANMLSIGTGPGHLERTLLTFSVPAKNIDIADIKLHSHIENSPFRKFEFDMSKQWPDFQRKYDYILFPESIQYYSQNTTNYGEYIDGMLKVIKQAHNNLNKNGEIRIVVNTNNDQLDIKWWINFWKILSVQSKQVLSKSTWKIDPKTKTIIIKRLD